MKRQFLKAGTLVAIVAAIAFGLPALSKTYWAGHQEMDVVVIVRDASELLRIANANIEVLDGPHSFENQEIRNEEFKSRDDQIFSTDDTGRAEFRCLFFAAGTESLFQESGYVDTDGVWLRVSAEGYHTTYIPVDRQSIRPRNINDDTPILVTVPVGKSQLTTDN